MNLALEQQDLYNPIDTIEGIFSRDNVSFDRRKDNELVAEVLGKWDNMLIFFAYEEHLAMLNENLWLGHFSYWSEQKMPIFKHSLILQDNEELFNHKISKIIELSIMECERVYPIFNAVMRQNVEPAQALSGIRTLRTS